MRTQTNNRVTEIIKDYNNDLPIPENYKIYNYPEKGMEEEKKQRDFITYDRPIDNVEYKTPIIIFPPDTYRGRKINFACLSVILQFIIVLLLLKLIKK